jgi:hypothetical protein
MQIIVEYLQTIKKIEWSLKWWLGLESSGLLLFFILHLIQPWVKYESESHQNKTFEIHL